MNKLGDISVEEFRSLVDEAIKRAPKDYYVAEVRAVVMEVVGQNHGQQHEFIAELIAERMEKRARIKKLQDVVAGSLIVSFIIGFMSLIGYMATEALKSFIERIHGGGQ